MSERDESQEHFEEAAPPAPLPVVATQASEAARPAFEPASVTSNDEAQPALTSAYRGARRWPLLGPTLWILGALLWSYSVAGQFVVVAALPEAVGGLGVLLTVAFTTWLCAREHALGAPPRSTRLAAHLRPLALAWLLAALIVACVSVPAALRRSDALITSGLALFGLGAFFVGRWRTNPARPWAGGFTLVFQIFAGISASTLTMVVVVTALDRL